jgi:lipopolysaccharide transport system permease protein
MATMHDTVVSATDLAAPTPEAPVSDAFEPSDAPHLIIRPSRGWMVLNLREVWAFRDLVWSLAARDLKLRYRQTALGVLWVIAQPLAAAVIFAFVFGKVARFSSDGMPYLVFAYAGLFVWNTFQTAIQKVSTCLISNAPLVTKVYFPRLVLPISCVLSSLVDVLVTLVILGVLMACYRIVPSWALLLSPVWLFLTLCLALGIGLIAAAMTVSYRDAQYVLPVALQLALYASPVAYSVALVPAKLRFLVELNPLAGLLEAMRWSLTATGDFHWRSLAYSAAGSTVALLWGAFLFRRMERDFADVI